VLCRNAFLERCETVWRLRYKSDVMPALVRDVVVALIEGASMLDLEDGYLAVVKHRRGTWRVQLWMFVEMAREVASRLDVDVVGEGGPDFQALPVHGGRV